MTGFRGSWTIVRVTFATCAMLFVSGMLTPNAKAAETKMCGTALHPEVCPPPAPVITPWQWYYTGSWGFLGAGPFDSLSRLHGYFNGLWSAANGCGSTTNYLTWNSSQVHVGIVYRDYFLRNTTVVNQSAPGVCDQVWTSDVSDTRTERGVFCPTYSGSISYQQGPPQVGPSCSQSTPPLPNLPSPLKALGNSCASNSGGLNSGAASPGSSATRRGNPCDVSNGNKHFAEVDYNGHIGTPLKFVRSYNSLAAYYDSTFPFPKPLGIGWTATYFQYLLPESVDNGATISTIYAVRPDGRVIHFVLYGGTYVPDADVSDVLTVSGSGYEYRLADDTLEVYDGSGKLQSVSYRGGAPVTVSYPAGGGYPTAATDAFGHTMTFAYVTENSRIVLKTLTDPAGQVVTFGYSTNGDLLSATYPDATTRNYIYGLSGGPNGLTPILTQLNDEASAAYATGAMILVASR